MRGPKLGFLPFSQVCIIGWNRAETSKKKKKNCSPNEGLTDLDWGRNEVFQHFLSYFVKRGQILLN